MNREGGAALLLSLVFLAGTVPARVQTGAIEFTVQVTPSSGIAEPVRGLPFYLLRKSFSSIQKEAAAAVPKPELNSFIGALKASKQLKDWMERNHTVSLSGDDFFRLVKPDDILDVPEFHDAYIAHNIGDRAFGFPTPKYKESDRARDPGKYKKQAKEYEEALRKYMMSNPESLAGIDLELMEIDPSRKWRALNDARLPEIRRRALELAQTKYRVATAQTDLNGRALLTGLPPGNYWLSTLEIQAEVGDTRESWDTPVSVEANQMTRIELSNFNAAESRQPIS